MSAPVLLLIGAGPNIGRGVASAFASKGYRIALAARRLSNETTSSGELHIKADLSDPSTVSEIFSTVTAKLGPPSVVVYNAAKFDLDGADPFSSFTTSKFHSSLAINTTSAILSIAESIKSFRQLPSSASRTFIYTGNALNSTIMSPMLTFGIAKNAAAYAIHSAAKNEMYKKEGMKFYYADERAETGGPIGSTPTAGEAGRVYVELSEKVEQGNWDYVYVEGKGEVKF